MSRKRHAKDKTEKTNVGVEEGASKNTGWMTRLSSSALLAVIEESSV